MDEMPPPGHALSGETPLRVLVADDIAASREEIGVLVRQFGHSVLLATGGRDALDVAAREEPDVVLLDLLMPDLDGFEVARELRRRVTDRWLPVVVTSSLQGDEHFIEALSCGADDCLARPVTPALLEAKLRHYQRVLGLQSRAAALAQRQQAIIDHIGDAIVTVDAAGRITEFNRAAAALFNAGPDDALTGALLVERLGCDSDARGTLVVEGMGTRYANFTRVYGRTDWIFEGQEIFKRAVIGMSGACADVLAARHMGPEDIDLVVPHQANLRIIEAVAKRSGVPMERVFVNVHRYGNMSAGTVPVALVEALEEGRVRPGSHLLLPAFGAGLTWCAHLVRWGERVTPLATTEVDLPPCDMTALDIVKSQIAKRAGTFVGR